MKLTIKEQIHFSKRLSFLLKAGTSLSDSISLLATQATKKKALFATILADISRGGYLYQTLMKFPTSFSPLAISLTRSGEESGTLAENFNRLAIELQKKQRFHQKLISALIYPSFIALATILLSSFLLFFIFPKIRPLFTNLSIPLPWSTKLLMNITDISFLTLSIMSGGIFLIILIVKFSYKKSFKVRLIFSKTLIKIPIIGKIIRQHELVTYLYTIGIMLQGGAPLDHASLVGSEVCKNLIYKNASRMICITIEQGKEFSEALAYSYYTYLFPKEVSDMLATSETAGTLPETLLYISEMYELELEETTKNLSSTLEPILMISMGLIVGFISLSIITPIYSLTQNIKQ
ncbi:MAG: type II secretion system F family protein [bacterium]|nr:type II secretion system F family protein [bacterium]